MRQNLRSAGRANSGHPHMHAFDADVEDGWPRLQLAAQRVEPGLHDAAAADTSIHMNDLEIGHAHK